MRCIQRCEGRCAVGESTATCVQTLQRARGLVAPPAPRGVRADAVERARQPSRRDRQQIASGNMLTSLVTAVLNRVLGDFVENLDAHNLNIGLLSGARPRSLPPPGTWPGADRPWPRARGGDRGARARVRPRVRLRRRRGAGECRPSTPRAGPARPAHDRPGWYAPPAGLGRPPPPPALTGVVPPKRVVLTPWTRCDRARPDAGTR